MKGMDVSHGEDHLYGGGYHSDLLRSTGKTGQKSGLTVADKNPIKHTPQIPANASFWRCAA